MIESTHALYRFYDAGGDLLYIGITNDPGRRWGRHANDKPWWQEVDRIEIERHPDRATVLAAEREAIIAEHPRYNVIHAKPAAASPSEPGPRPQGCECGAAAEYVYVLHTEIHAYERAWGEIRQQRGSSWEPADLSRYLLDSNDLRAMPSRASWRFTCDPHLPEDGTYGFACPTTWTGWMRKSAHLLDTKDWITSTNWGQTLAALAGWE